MQLYEDRSGIVRFQELIYLTSSIKFGFPGGELNVALHDTFCWQEGASKGQLTGDLVKILNRKSVANYSGSLPSAKFLLEVARAREPEYGAGQDWRTLREARKTIKQKRVANLESALLFFMPKFQDMVYVTDELQVRL